MIPSQQINIFLVVVACLAGLITLSQTAHSAEVDVIVLYDKATADQEQGNPTAKFRSIIDNANIIYKNNGIDIQIRMISLEPWFVSVPDENKDTLDKLSASDKWDKRREELGADLISWFVVTKDGSCGRARWARKSDGTLNPDRSHVSMVKSSCSYISFVHELGHNMGLGHSRKQDPDGGHIYEYGTGYGVQDTFATIMAYWSVFNTRRLPQFSDPTKNCKNVKM